MPYKNTKLRKQYAQMKNVEYRLRRFGIGMSEYLEMAERQGRVCAICKKECETGMWLAVDHDHKTNVVRGLLCFKCNTGLGHFDDDPERLKLAAEYIRARR
jgi:hypothetical protein